MTAKFDPVADSASARVMNGARLALQELTGPLKGSGGNFFAIDILRGLAAITILIVHFRHFFHGNGFVIPNDLKEIWIIDLLWPLYQHGSQAELLIWLISGFVFIH
ncbi:MAG: hypothetical protein HRU11_12060, partial [Parvularculaceae bacterium]|nr:hypothetical protein [Parvularculaceae bacterium]